VLDTSSNTIPFFVGGSGKVGIGTTSPEFNLDVNSSSTATIQAKGVVTSLILNHTTTNFQSAVNFRENGADKFIIGTSVYNPDSTSFDIGTAAASLFRIQANGNVGIGTGTASLSYKLDVKTGTNEHLAVASALGGFGFSAPLLDAVDDSNNLLPMVYNASKHVFYNGNVGIGQMAPSAKLEVFGPSDAAFTGPSNSLLYLNSDDTNNNWRGVTFGRSGYALGKIGIQRTASGSYMAFGTSNNYGVGITKQAMTIDPAGNVGIGTPAPGVALDVVGSIHASGGITADGTVRATFQDLAEWVPSSGEIAAGTVVIVSESAGNTVVPSTTAYDTRVAGVVSPAPGLLLGIESPSKSKIATTGRVKVRVDASMGAIRLGDLLVTSDTPGTAMKSEPLDLGGVKIHRPGTIIGKALEPLAKGQGEILVLLSLQ
jgi:hypothetical protein